MQFIQCNSFVAVWLCVLVLVSVTRFNFSSGVHSPRAFNAIHAQAADDYAIIVSAFTANTAKSMRESNVSHPSVSTFPQATGKRLFNSAVSIDSFNFELIANDFEL